MEFLDRLMGGLAEQDLELEWDVYAIDSSSSDGTWEALEAWGEKLPVKLARERITSVEFDHGDTRNLLAARSRGDLLVFLTQDAIPSDPSFLTKLVKNFEDSDVAAVTCRNVPRPDAQLLTKLFSENDPGYSAGRREVRLSDVESYEEMSAHERRLLYNFNDVAAGYRRELWQLHPFPRTPFGEDVLMARALLEAGYTVVYDDEATVEHSHDYTPKEHRTRGEIDARFNAEWLDRICVASKSDAKELTKRQLKTDTAAIAAAGYEGAEADALLREAKAQREATFLGLHEGGRTPHRRATTKVSEGEPLSLLYVVHGFPPDTWAGTEIYTQNIALEMQRRGHSVTVLARVPADGVDAPEDFSIEESEFQGLRVLRWTHRLEHGSIADSYHHPAAEAAFRRLLIREDFDLVHFQHLIHSSAGLVSVAKEFALPTIITCHDYWGLCARVQLIRPDGEICEGNQGAGCFLCVKEKALDKVPAARALGKVAGGAFDGLIGGLKAFLGEDQRQRLEGYEDTMARHDFVLNAYSEADLCISPSRFLRQKYLESGRFDPHRFLFSDNGMRTDHVEALAKTKSPKGRVRFGFVGSLVWYKGDETMIRAMQRLKDAPCELNVYGTFDPEGDEHHAELQALAEGAQVNFKGRFDNSRLSEVYADIDVLVVPSVWYENSPITIHEAYLTETPVLASDIGGMAEFVKDGVDGLHFKVGDPGDLAEKMERFVDEPDLVERLSGDFMRVKTLEENGEEMEARYRALTCVDRSPEGAGALLVRSARDTAAQESCVEQGADWLLLTPGGGAVEYELEGSGGGRRELALSVALLAVESDSVEMGGRIVVDGEEIAQIEPFFADDADEVREVCLDVDLSADAARLRIECALSEGGPEAHLRLTAFEVRPVRAITSDEVAS
jgi:glycosyltransferase involved in cell wall biosynthesis